jgi:prepilin-type N-terminal cleavage/methylation domain-containing protein
LLFKTNKTFSLIELLVVISIMGVLVSLLQPTLKKIATSAQTLTCSQNLHHFFKAIALYVDDNNDILVPYAWRSKYPDLPRQMWFDYLNMYHGSLQNARVCPSTEIKTRGGWGRTDLTWNWGGQVGSYAYNSYFHSIYYRWGRTIEEMPNWFQNFHFIKLQNVPRPTMTGIMADSSWVDAWPRNFQAGPNSAAVGGLGGETSMARIAVNRHDWGTNVLKADGSVGYFKLEELWSALYWNLNDKPQPAPEINP